MRLLLMEDDILLCQILKYRFEEENIKRETSYTGNEGMEIAHTQKSDIIHDCILPDINGNRILKKYLLAKSPYPLTGCSRRHLISKSTIPHRVWGMDTYIYDGNLGNYIYFIRNHLKTVHSKIVLKTVHDTSYGRICGDFDV